MTAEAGAYAGLTPAEAQERVVADLRAQGLIRDEEPYTHTVPFSHRSGARVEPLVSLQWFCDMTQLAAPAIAAVEQGRVRFTPPKWGEVYLNWMREIRPWCVSRQLWWGHRIPVWYRGEEVHVGREAPEGEGWVRDEDVLDTWFSSALWPFATLGWPERTPELERFYPTQVLSTARDIIFLWVARMVMMGVEYMGEEPFADVYIHSVVQAADGRRMSKSLGTGIDPIDQIDLHGADALRFGLLMMSSTQDVRYSADRIDQGRQLVTKLWNASRLVVDRGGRAGIPAPEPVTLADRWIVSRISAAVEQSRAMIDGFQLSQLADLVYHLVFDDYCDWYLELLKAGEATPEVAGHALEQLLALAHPLMPFVTEECWSRMPGAEGLMAVHPPAAAPGPADPEAEAEIAAVQDEVTAFRGWRARRGVPPRQELVVERCLPLSAVLARRRGGHQPGGVHLAGAREGGVDRRGHQGPGRRSRRRARAPVRGAGGGRERARARRGQARATRRSWSGPRPSWSTPSARRSPGSPTSARRCSHRSPPWADAAGGGPRVDRGARDPRHALRPGAHGGPAGRAGPPRGASPRRCTSSAPTASRPPRAWRRRRSPSQGRRVGTYLSPHVTDWTERFQVARAADDRGRVRRRRDGGADGGRAARRCPRATR